MSIRMQSLGDRIQYTDGDLIVIEIIEVAKIRNRFFLFVDKQENMINRQIKNGTIYGA